MTAPRYYAPQRPALAQPMPELSGQAGPVSPVAVTAEKAAPVTQPNNLKAILWMIAASVAFTALVVSVRELSANLPTAEILFFRAAFSVSLLLPWAFRTGWSGVRSNRMLAHSGRCLSTFIAMMLWFHATGLTTLADAVAIQSTYPLFTIILAMLVLGERPGWFRWAATMTGFAGMLIIVRPGVVEIGPPTMMLLGAAVFYAISNIFVKYMSDTEPANRMVFIQNASLALLSLGPAVYYWVTPELADIPMIILLVISGLAAHMCLTRALAAGEASVVMPFDYLRLPFAAILGFLLYLEVPDAPTIIGGVVIFMAVSAIATTERKGGK
jgi:drug/metabolite transporter (DMT)-like permease